jgi:hypothetical protein
VSDERSSYPQDRPYDQPQQAYQEPYPQAYEQQPYQQPYQAYEQAYPPPYQQPYGSEQIRFQPQAAAVEHPRAVLAFVLGLLSVLGLSILGPFGWYYGNKVVAEIDSDGRPFTNRGVAMTGKVLGIIGTVFLGFFVLAVVALIVFGILVAASST